MKRFDWEDWIGPVLIFLAVLLLIASCDIRIEINVSQGPATVAEGGGK